MSIDNIVDYLLSRTIDPLSKDYEMIVRMDIKQKLYKVFREIEKRTKKRTIITDGFAREGHSPHSYHYKGRACDFVLVDMDLASCPVVTPNSDKRILKIVEEIVRKKGFYFLNEWENVTPYTTGGHYHIEWRRK